MRKRCAIWTTLFGVLSLTGCCRWAEEHCPTCKAAAAAPPATCCQPCQPCCAAPVAPVAVGYQAPVPAVPAQSWQRPVQQMNCTCQPTN
jgi:hypothetical protein